MKKILFGLMMLLSTAFAGCSDSSSNSSSDAKNTIPDLTVAQKEEDFEYLCKILSENYPYFEVNKRLNKGFDWLGKKEEYRKRLIQTTNNLDYLVKLIYIMDDLKNGHTGILYTRNSYSEFSDLFLKTYSDLADREPWRNVFREAQPYFDGYWSDQMGKLTSPSLINTGEYRKPPLRSFQNGESASFEIIESGKTAYMKLDSMPDPTEAERQKILSFYSQLSGYENLIIDIRTNGGGGAGYWTDLVMAPLISSPVTSSTISLFRGGSYLDQFIRARGIQTSDIASLPERSNYPPECKKDFTKFVNNKIIVNPSSDTIGFKGKVYLLVGSDTFSSAESFAMFCKETKWATIVGTETGGDGGEGGTGIIVAILPNSKLVFTFPGDMSLNADGSSNFETKTTPDVLIGTNEDALTRTLAIISGK
ncbi:MAG TPA: S41 family peptidase [Spirochaetota bacterium]|nr:S41 family peptidase [Spirochaetota bacterium]